MTSPFGIMGLSRIARVNELGQRELLPARRTLALMGGTVVDNSRAKRTDVSFASAAAAADALVAPMASGFFDASREGWFGGENDGEGEDETDFTRALVVLAQPTGDATIVGVRDLPVASSSVYRKYLVNISTYTITLDMGGESAPGLVLKQTRVLHTGESARFVYDRLIRCWWVNDGPFVPSDYLTRDGLDVTRDGEVIPITARDYVRHEGAHPDELVWTDDGLPIWKDED
jgi:hypothetical protein